MLLDKDFKCETVSMEDVYEYSRVLAGKAREDGFKPDVVIAFARGGYAPARYLKNFLLADKLLTLHVEHVWASKKARVCYPLQEDIAGKNVLVVDDLVDTGKSFKAAVAYLKALKPKKVKTAAVFLIEKAAFKPDYYGAKKEWKWFLFPWNAEEDMRHLVAGLFERKSGDKKSLDMVAEELEVRHGLSLERQKLKSVLNDLCARSVLKPFMARGRLLRWMSA